MQTRLLPCGIVLAAAVIGPLRPVGAAEAGYCAQPALCGDRLVFVSEGDLWSAMLPAEAEAQTAPIIAHRLTSSDGDESQPTISADGRWLAFSGQYDGNTDVFVMPAEGGPPRRLTFHPDPDVVLGWQPDGAAVFFSSARSNPLDRPELWRIAVGGGMPARSTFGECTMIAVSPVGRRFAFTRWSNEHWSWKRYRGGTAPDIWIGDESTGSFHQLTRDASNDQFPMWVQGRVFFLSDRTGTANIFSDRPEGGDLKQHTTFAADAARPTLVEGYDARWPSADARPRGGRIAFCQAGGLALLETATGMVRRLDVRLASDRVAARERFAAPMATATSYALSADGSRVILSTRGEVMVVPVEPGPTVQVTRSSGAREWGASPLSDSLLVMISDAAGEQQIVTAPMDGSGPVSALTSDREDWLFAPVASPDGTWVAFGDKTLRLHVINTATLMRSQVDQSEAGEITDYRFSPDSQWLAYTRPMPSGMGMVMIHSLRTGRSFPVSDGLTADGEPRWDPAGKYLYFLSRRHLDPVISDLDFEHAFMNTTVICIVPLAENTPPPVPLVARAAGFDLEAWAEPEESEESGAKGKAPSPAPAAGADARAAEPAPVPGAAAPPPPAGREAIRIDTENLPARQYAAAIEPGNYSDLEAIRGGVLYGARPVEGLMSEVWPAPPLGLENATIHRYDFVTEEDSVVAEHVSGYALSADGGTLAHPTEGGFSVRALADEDEPKTVDLSEARVRIDVRTEWGQMLDEAWRLQRDFYWAPNFAGVNWGAVREKYRALLPLIGTRDELNDLIGEMIGELGTSHTYVWGGERHDEAEPVPVGMLGADIEFDAAAGGFVIRRILSGSGRARDDRLRSPLADPYLGAREGGLLLAINQVPLAPGDNLHDRLQDQAGKVVRLTIADDAARANTRTIEVKTIDSERMLRYDAWVETNRMYVEEKSEGRLGYLHIPDMGGEGLVAFGRLFYPQINKRGLVVDVRNNGGGFVSQMIVQRLARKVWAFMQPRHGFTERYPQRSLHGHLAVLIDQHAGSDGDIFPASFRMLGLGPLIGTRTWGGVVGIRADKPFVDAGVSTQPEFAWWVADGGWTIENQGVAPDLEVEITPADRVAGRDPQLDKAIEALLAKLKDDPKELPRPPAWPVR
jgi:tricorn protease